MNRLRLNRIKYEMSSAAKQGKVYHLWWHPHNFGTDPLGSMRELQEVILHFQKLRDEFGMKSQNMREIGEWAEIEKFQKSV